MIRCRATGCDQKITPDLVMCLHHWRMVCRELRTQISRIWGIVRRTHGRAGRDTHRALKLLARDCVRHKETGEGTPSCHVGPQATMSWADRSQPREP